MMNKIFHDNSPKTPFFCLTLIHFPNSLKLPNTKSVAVKNLEQKQSLEVKSARLWMAQVKALKGKGKACTHQQGNLTLLVFKSQIFSFWL